MFTSPHPNQALLRRLGTPVPVGARACTPLPNCAPGRGAALVVFARSSFEHVSKAFYSPHQDLVNVTGHHLLYAWQWRNAAGQGQEETTRSSVSGTGAGKFLQAGVQYPPE